MELCRNALDTIRNAIDNEPGMSNEDMKNLVDRVEQGIEGAQSYKFSAMALANLASLNITVSGNPLILRPNYEAQILPTIPYGREVWSSETLRHHLYMLETSIARTNEAGVRARIDAFLLRVTAMFPSLPGRGDQRLVFHLEKQIPPISAGPSSLSTLSGTLDYAAVVVDRRYAGYLLTSPSIEMMKSTTPMLLCFFIIEAKAEAFNLTQHLPQVVGEILACARHFEKKVLRTTLTNGRSWIFVIVCLNEGNNGASYRHSEEIKLDASPTSLMPDLISATLLSWISKSFSDLQPDEWFQSVTD